MNVATETGIKCICDLFHGIVSKHSFSNVHELNSNSSNNKTRYSLWIETLDIERCRAIKTMDSWNHNNDCKDDDGNGNGIILWLNEFNSKEIKDQSYARPNYIIMVIWLNSLGYIDTITFWFGHSQFNIRWNWWASYA